MGVGGWWTVELKLNSFQQGEVATPPPPQPHPRSASEIPLLSSRLPIYQELVKMFNFHNYDNLKHTVKKLDPRKRKVDNEANAVVNLLFGAANGDVTAIRR